MRKSLKIVAATFAAAFMFSVAGSAHAQFVVPEVRVNIAPPPPRYEVRTIAPGAGYNWIGGHWAWRYGRHVWMPGHWAMPPQAGMVWEPAHWRPVNGQWAFVEGHWRYAAPPAPVVYEPPPPPQQPVYVQTEPPPVINEVRPVAPFGGAVWIPGYWHWNGYSHVWVGGHWSAARAGWMWEPDHWVHGPTGWYRVQGHWRR